VPVRVHPRSSAPCVQRGGLAVRSPLDF